MLDDKATDELIGALKLYGDRTSSFMTSYPGFKSFASPDTVIHGQIRFMETSKAWIAGTEPLTSPELKLKLFADFGNDAGKNGKRALMVPVTGELSKDLARQGCRRLQVGSEPIFELDSWFQKTKDPLDGFPHARSLLKRGARVLEISSGELTPLLQAELDKLTSGWLGSRRTVPLSFLNQVDPWRHRNLKKLFVLQLHGKTQAFLSAVPVFQKNGYFFADYIRAPGTRAGTIELLIIEAMRALQQQGYQEVRMGICPLARLDSDFAKSLTEKIFMRVMQWIFKHGTFPYSFKSIHEFKSKFNPTRWEPLFLVTRGNLGPGALSDLVYVQFPGGMYQAWLSGIKRKGARLLRPDVRLKAAPGSFSECLQRSKLSLSFGLLFLGLHLLRHALPAVQSFFLAHGFSAAHFTVQGLIAGPLFHNNHYHLTGDLLSFWAFGIVLEIFLGSMPFFWITAAGLWATNPITVAVLHFPLQYFSPAAHARLFLEIDYGSSNAVYAAVGALAALLSKPAWLLMPFVLNGVFLCLARSSWLSFHHLVGLAVGYAAGHAIVRWARRTA